MKKLLVTVLIAIFAMATLTFVGCYQAVDHQLVKVEAVEATCESAGNIEYWQCKDCKKLYKDEGATEEITLESTVIAPLGHKLLKQEKTEPTCASAGKAEHWKCERCGKLYKDGEGKTETTEEELAIPALDHQLTNHPSVSATCETAGNIEYWTCDVCGKYFSDKDGKTEITAEEIVVAALGHNLTAHEKVEATCETSGNIAYWTCDVCGKYFSDEEGKTEITEADTVIEALGHKLTNHPAIEAGVNAGNIEYWTCDVCGKYFSDKDGTTEITKEDTVVKLAFDAANPASYVYTEVPYSYNAELNCYETLYEGVYNWKTPESVVIVKKEYIDYLISEGYDKLNFRVVRANDVDTQKIAVAANDPGATELGTFNGTEGQYTVLLNDLPTDEYIVKDGNITLKFFANKLAVELQVYITPLKITEADIYMGYVETGSPYTYNVEKRCYERDYPGNGYGDDTKFTIKREYLDILRERGASELDVVIECEKADVEKSGNVRLGIAKADENATDISNRGIFVRLNKKFDLGNIVETPDLIDAEGNITLKIYAGASCHFKVYITSNDPTSPTSYIESGMPYVYNSEENCYEADYLSNYGYKDVVSTFTIKSSHIERLKAEGKTKLMIRVTGAGSIGIAKADENATDISNRGADVSLKNPIDIGNLVETPHLIDAAGNITLKIYSSADCRFKVYITAE